MDLSDNNLGDYGARALADMLKENSTLKKLNLSGNNFTDRSAEHLGPALITNAKLQHLDLSHNTLGEHAGRVALPKIKVYQWLSFLSMAVLEIQFKQHQTGAPTISTLKSRKSRLYNRTCHWWTYHSQLVLFYTVSTVFFGFGLITRVFEPDCRDLPPFSHRGINEMTVVLAAQVWLTARTPVVGWG